MESSHARVCRSETRPNFSPAFSKHLFHKSGQLYEIELNRRSALNFVDSSDQYSASPKAS